MIAAPDKQTAIEYAINSSCTTHASADCLDSTELLGAVLWELRQGADLKALLENLPDTEERGMAVGRIKSGFFRHKTAPTDKWMWVTRDGPPGHP